VDATALAILKRQGSRGITILSLQRRILFDIQVNPYWQKWHTKLSKQAAKDFQTSKFHQDTWDRYLMVGIVSVHIPWKAISNLQIRHSHKALRDHLVLQSAMTLANICRREYALTVDAIKKELPVWNTGSLALDGWTSTSTLAITSILAYYIDGNWALCEVTLLSMRLIACSVPVSKTN